MRIALFGFDRQSQQPQFLFDDPLPVQQLLERLVYLLILPISIRRIIMMVYFFPGQLVNE